MGLFSKKPKEPEYDAVDCERKKKKFERGFIFDWNTTTFFCYIVGFRRSDFSLVLV